MQPPALRFPSRQLLVIVLAQILALTIQAWLSRILLERGYEQLQAHYLAYLVVPPVLLLVIAPILLEHRHFLKRLFSPQRLTLRLALAAVTLGIAIRLAWWAQLIARVSFGITRNEDSESVIGPVFSFACPPLHALSLGILVMAALIPFIEETIHRGLVQSAFVHKGPAAAIIISALIFTVFHPPTSYGFVFLIGLVLGAQFWLTGSLWATIITHATYNGLAQLDWRCIRGHWNPTSDSLPQVAPGGIALLILAATCLLVLVLLRYQRAGAQMAPTTAATKARSQRAR